MIYPKLKVINDLPLAITKPPSTNTNWREKVPSVLATTSVLPAAARNRNKERAI